MAVLLALPAQARKAQPVEIDWVALPGGSFLMGHEGGEEGELPVHRVTVKPFALARAPVTVKQYRACMKAGVCTAPAPECDFDKFHADESQPVVCVSWDQASAFCAWVGGRLPSEAEWEYAARSGGKDQRYPWGNEEPTCDRAVMREEVPGCGRDATWPVCSKPKGNSEQGLCDLAGNVWEWMSDYYHKTYYGAPDDGSAYLVPKGSKRANRGSSWYLGASRFRATLRRMMDAKTTVNGTGFRPAKSLAER